MFELIDFKRQIPESVNCYKTLYETKYVITKVGKIDIEKVTQTIQTFGNRKKYTEEYYLIQSSIYFKAQDALNFAIALNAGLGFSEAEYYVDFTSRMLKPDNGR